MTLRCRHKLPNPETAGCDIWDSVKAAADASPELRPCYRQQGSRGTWNWIYKVRCEKCPDVVRVE